LPPFRAVINKPFAPSPFTENTIINEVTTRLPSLQTKDMASLSSIPTELRQQIFHHATELTLSTTALLETVFKDDFLGFRRFESSSSGSNNGDPSYGTALHQNRTATKTVASLLSTNHLFREEIRRTVKTRVDELRNIKSDLEPFTIKHTGTGVPSLDTENNPVYLITKKSTNEWIVPDIRFLIVPVTGTRPLEMMVTRVVREFPP